MSCQIGYASIHTEVGSCGFQPEIFCLAAGYAVKDAKAVGSHRLLGITGIMKHITPIKLFFRNYFSLFLVERQRKKRGIVTGGSFSSNNVS